MPAHSHLYDKPTIRPSDDKSVSQYQSRFQLLEPNVVATLQDVHCRRKRDPEKRAISLEVSRVIARSERISPTTEENLNP